MYSRFYAREIREGDAIVGTLMRALNEAQGADALISGSPASRVKEAANRWSLADAGPDSEQKFLSLVARTRQLTAELEAIGIRVPVEDPHGWSDEDEAKLVALAVLDS